MPSVRAHPGSRPGLPATATGSARNSPSADGVCEFPTKGPGKRVLPVCC